MLARTRYQLTFLAFALGSIPACHPKEKTSEQSLAQAATSSPCPTAVTGTSSNTSNTGNTAKAKETNPADTGNTTNAQTNALVIGTGMVSDLCNDLNATQDPTATAAVTDAATEAMQTAVGTLIIDPGPSLAASSKKSVVQLITSPIVQGAFLGLTKLPEAQNTVDGKVLLAQGIMSGTSLALKNKTTRLTTDETLDIISGMTTTAVQNLPTVDLAGDNASTSVAAVTSAAVGNLPRAGIASTAIGQGAQKLAEGAVVALSAPGFDPASLGSLSGEVAGSAIQGLSSAGLSAENIVQAGAIERIISGTASGLKKSETSTSVAMEAMGSIAGVAVSVLGKVGMSSPDLQKTALAAIVKTSMSSAQSLASDSKQAVADAMSAVASKSVLALTKGGFESAAIGDAIGVIVKTGVSEIASNGFKDASAATDITSKLIAGAMAGAGTLMQSGALDSSKAGDLAKAASNGAVDGLKSLQTAGIVTGDSLTTFTDSIVESVSSGLQKGGVDSTVVASAQSSAQTVMQSDAVVNQIQSNAGTSAQAVDNPVFSVNSGSFSAAISVTISASTAGSSVRYTLDGSTPTATTGTLYTGAIAISASKTLKAIAYKIGWTNSSVQTATYTIQVSLFGSPTLLTTGTGPEGLAVGDLNGDGKTDLAVANYSSQSVSLFRNNGAGTFVSKQDVANSPNGSNIGTMMIDIGDLNNDNIPDVAWGAWGNNIVSYLTNTTSAGATTITYANNQPTALSPGVSGPQAVVITDIDADGYKDIMVGEGNGNKLLMYLNQGNGTFVKFGTSFLLNPDNSIYNGNAHPSMIGKADFNNDGKPDIYAGGMFGGIIAVVLNNTVTAGTPNFQTANRWNTVTSHSCSNNSWVTSADFNGDGKPDLAAICPSTGDDKVLIYLNQTAANATAATFTVSSLTTAKTITGVAAGDMDGDGVADLVVAISATPDLLVFYKGLGNGSFAAADNYSLSPGTGANRVIVADLNGDGKLDAIVTMSGSNQAAVILNQTP